MPNSKQKGAAAPRQFESPVQDAVAKVAMDPKLSYEDVAVQVRKMVKGCQTSAKSVASLVLRLRKRGIRVPPRARPQAAEGARAHA